MAEIRQGLATGREVIAHPDRISVAGFTGEGYIIFDPVSGGGAYKITGGSNGGFFNYDEPGSLVVTSLTILHLKQFADVLNPFVRILQGGLSGLGLGINFVEIMEHCGPEVAAVLTTLIYFITEFISKASIALALSGVGLLGAIFVGIVGFFISKLITDLIVSLSTTLCSLSTRRITLFRYA